jgi:hypothetical protein
VAAAARVLFPEALDVGSGEESRRAEGIQRAELEAAARWSLGTPRSLLRRSLVEERSLRSWPASRGEREHAV